MIVINFWPPCQGRQVSVCVVDGECFEFVFVLVPVLENAASQIIRPHVSNSTLVYFFNGSTFVLVEVEHTLAP